MPPSPRWRRREPPGSCWRVSTAAAKTRRPRQRRRKARHRRAGRSSAGLSRALLKEDDAQRGEQNAQIEKQAVVFYVVKVIAELFAGVLERGAVGGVDLRPAGKTGFDAM